MRNHQVQLVIDMLGLSNESAAMLLTDGDQLELAAALAKPDATITGKVAIGMERLAQSIGSSINNLRAGTESENKPSLIVYELERDHPVNVPAIQIEFMRAMAALGTLFVKDLRVVRFDPDAFEAWRAQQRESSPDGSAPRDDVRTREDWARTVADSRIVLATADGLPTQ